MLHAHLFEPLSRLLDFWAQLKPILLISFIKLLDFLVLIRPFVLFLLIAFLGFNLTLRIMAYRERVKQRGKNLKNVINDLKSTSVLHSVVIEELVKDADETIGLIDAISSRLGDVETAEQVLMDTLKSIHILAVQQQEAVAANEKRIVQLIGMVERLTKIAKTNQPKKKIVPAKKPTKR